MYKKIVCAMLVASMTLAIGGCSINVTSTDENSLDETVSARGRVLPSESSDTESSETESESSDEESSAVESSKPEVQTTVSDDWRDFEFNLMGKNLKIPFDYSELEELGWSIDLEELGYEDGYILNSGESTACVVEVYNDDYDASFSVAFGNTGSKACDITECQIISIDIECDFAKKDLPELVIAKGITWGSSIEDVETAFGEPEDEPYYADELGYYSYNYDDDYYNTLNLIVYEDGGVKEIFLDCYGYEKLIDNTSTSKTESKASSKATSSVSSKNESSVSSKSSSETESKTESKTSSSNATSGNIADNWDSFQFMLDGKLFNMMCDYADLEAEGWSFDLADYGYDDGYVLNRDDGVWGIELEKDGYEITADVGIQNVGDKACDITEGQIWQFSFSIEFEDGKIPDIVLPGGIKWGSTLEEIEEAYGEPTDEPYYAESLNYYSYEYETDLNSLSLTIYDDGGLKEFKYSIYSPEKL